MPIPVRDLTDEELEVVEAFGEAGTLFSELPPSHPADLREMILHLHAIQNIVYSRPAFDAYKRDSGYEPEDE